MDFVKLQELPKLSATIGEDSDARKFRGYKKRLEEACGPGSDVSAISFSPATDISQLAVACGSKVQIYDLGFGSATETISWSKHKNLLHCVAYRRDGKLLIAADGDGHANIYDVGVTKGIIRRLRGHDGAIFATCFCGDNSRVSTAGADQFVKVWDIPTGQVIHNMKGHTDSVRALMPVGENGLLSAGADGSICYWDVAEGTQLSVVSHGSPIEKLAMFESGAMFFSIGSGSAKLWDVRSLSQISATAKPVKHTKPVTAATVSQCGDYLATASFDKTVKITRISTWEVVASFTCPSPVTAMAWKGESICIGLENGSWLLRQRRPSEQTAEAADTATAAPAVAFQTDQARYYKTTLVGSSAAASKSKEANADYLFRKFEYRKLVDYVVEGATTAGLAMAVFDELIQRGGLLPAVRDRTAEELTQLVTWCTKNLVADPRCSIAVVSQVLQSLVEGNAKLLARVPETEGEKKLMEAVKILSGRVAQELALQYRSAALVGLIESVLSTA